MPYYMVKYEGYGEHEYRITEQQEYSTPMEAIEALQGQVGVEHLFAALEHSFSEMVYWVTDTEGYAVATEFEVDPTDG